MIEAKQVDVLAVGAHPDDVEISCAGTLLKLKTQGKKTAVVDMTRGEMGTRGTPEIRRREAREAQKQLGLEFRVNLELPDSQFVADSNSRLKLIRVLRQSRPRLVLTHSRFAHPDHLSTHQLVFEAVHHAGLAGVDTGQERYRPPRVGCWLDFNQPDLPHFIVDISDFYRQKEEVIRVYRSQLFQEESDEPETYLSRPGYLKQLESFHRHLGSLGGCLYGEGFQFSRIPRIEDPTRC